MLNQMQNIEKQAFSISQPYKYSKSSSFEAFHKFIDTMDYAEHSKKRMLYHAKLVHEKYPLLTSLQEQIDRRGIIDFCKESFGDKDSRASAYIYFLYMIEVLDRFRMEYFFHVNPKTIHRLKDWYRPYFREIGIDVIIQQCLDIARRSNHRKINVDTIEQKVEKTCIYLCLKYKLKHINELTEIQWTEFINQATEHAARLQNYTCNTILQQAFYELHIFDTLFLRNSKTKNIYLTKVYTFDKMENIKPITDLYREYCVSTFAPGTCYQKYQAIERLFKYIEERYGMEFSLDKLTRGMIHDYISNVLQTGTTYSNKQTLIYGVKTFLEFVSANMEEIKKNGCQVFRQNIIVSNDFNVKSDNYLPRPIEDNVLNVFLMALREIEQTKFRLAFLMMLLTGVAMADLLNLKHNCLNKLSDNTYVLNIWRTKVKKNYTVKINGEVVAIIRQIQEMNTQIEPLPHPDGRKAIYLFNDGGKNVSASWFKTKFKTLREIAAYNAPELEEQIIKVTPHRLRHTFASRLRDGGVDIYALKYLLGHSNINTTHKYIKESDQAKIVNFLNNCPLNPF